MTFADVNTARFSTRPLVSKINERQPKQYSDQTNEIKEYLSEHGFQREMGVVKQRVKQEEVEVPMIITEMTVAGAQEEKKMEKLKEVYGAI